MNEAPKAEVGISHGLHGLNGFKSVQSANPWQNFLQKNGTNLKTLAIHLI
jgi:hypothetical protein